MIEWQPKMQMEVYALVHHNDYPNPNPTHEQSMHLQDFLSIFWASAGLSGDFRQFSKLNTKPNRNTYPIPNPNANPTPNPNPKT